jgi:membrane-associated protease RseP (regulator of RpoE activity)
MGIHDRDYFRDSQGRPGRRDWLPQPSLSVVLAAVAVLGFSAILWQLSFEPSDRLNSFARVMNMTNVGWAGIGWDGVPQAEQASLGVPCALRITNVVPGGPADQAGLRLGDLIVGSGDKPFRDIMEFQGNARILRPGDTLILNVVRGTDRLAIEMTLTSWSDIERQADGPLGL